MNNQDKRTWAEIDLGNLKHNYFEIKRVLPEGTGVIAVCKANAYGHGAAPVARRLEEIGADMIAVSCYEEALELKAAGIRAPLLLLSPSLPFMAADIARMGAIQAVGDLEVAKRMSAALEGTGLTLGIHVKLETGMGRIGFNTADESAADQLRELTNLPNLRVCGVFTHFASADDPGQENYTLTQLDRFTKTADAVEAASGASLGPRHCSNSGGVVNYPQAHMDLVRPGLLLYGVYPGAEKGGMDLRPVMTVKTRVCAITQHSAGDNISYGRTYTCPGPCRLAVIPIGYADGLHRASQALEMSVNGRRVRQGPACGRAGKKSRHRILRAALRRFAQGREGLSGLTYKKPLSV